MRSRWVAIATALGLREDEHAEDFSDRWSPMVVREVRRMLKSQYFGISYVLLTLTCLLVCLVFVMSSGQMSYLQEAGQELCAWMVSLLCIPLMVVIPGSLFHAATQEHDESTIELLSITTLSTDQILFGYLKCAWLQGMMYASALVPFISFSYLLRGLGLFEVLGSLLWILLWAMLAAMWGLMLGCCARSQVSRVICTILMLLGLSIGLGICITGAASILMMGDAAALGGTLLCMMVVSLPGIAIFFGIAKQQFQITDPLVKPYLVVLDENQQVVRFASRYNALTHPPFEYESPSA